MNLLLEKSGDVTIGTLRPFPGVCVVVKHSVVKFINILCARFLPIFWYQKISKLFLRFENFWCLNIRNKCVCKMLMKFTPVVKFANILWAIFWLFSFDKRITNSKSFCKRRKASKKHFDTKKDARKMLIKLKPGAHFINMFTTSFFRCKCSASQILFHQHVNSIFKYIKL